MKRFILLFLAIVAMHNLWATTYTFTITTSDFNNTSYAANNGEHTSVARNPLNSSDILSIRWYSNQVMLMSGVIQFQKSSGYIYNITSLSYIKQVKVNSTDGTFTTYYGSEQHPTETTSENLNYFTVQNGSTTGKVTSIVVTIETQGGNNNDGNNNDGNNNGDNNNGGNEKPVETADNVITYTASEKLAETTSFMANGLHTNAFNVSITSHTFSNGTGTITFSGKVTSIGIYAFYGCSGLKSVTIPNSVTSIGGSAFSSCSGLTSITIPNSVTSIEGSTFSGCSSLTSITIPNSVTSIGYAAFYGCSGLTSITIPNPVTSIGMQAFYGCSGLTSITIPNPVTSIGMQAFYGCSGLTSVTIPNSVTNIESSVFRGCSSLTSITIPNSVTSIGYAAFYGCSGLTSVTIPNSVTSIGDAAFYRCSNLTSVTIPNSVTSIGNQAFEYCSNLTSVTIPNSVTSIGNQAFEYCSSLTSVTIPNSVTSIGSDAFFYCFGLTSVTIGNSVASIGDQAFYGCTNLKTVYDGSALNITKGSTYDGYVAYYADKVYHGIPIGDFVIKNDSLLIAYLGEGGNVVIPESVTSIGDAAFYRCSGLTSVTIPNSVTSIGNQAFEYCSGLMSVTIGNSVKSIGKGAFGSCSQLTSITIPNSVTSIRTSAFRDCSGLTKVNITDIAAWCSISFENGGYANPLEYAHYLYINGVRVKSLQIPNYVTNIGDFAFYQCFGITSVTIGNSVTSIGQNAFYDCSGLTSVTIPNSVTNIGYWAFHSCSSLTSVTIGSAVTSIGGGAFYNCRNLKTVYNLSSLNIVKGSSAYGYVAYYADNVYKSCSFKIRSSSEQYGTASATLKGNTIANDTTLWAGERLILLATPKNGYQFIQWSDGYTANPRNVTLTGDVAFTAYFEPATYSISLSAIANGSVSGNNTGGYQETITITATPDYGYHFAQWSDGNTSNPRTLVLTRDTAFVAEFVPNSYSVSLKSADSAKGIVKGKTTALYKEQVIITATANYGFHFSRWSDGNTSNPRTIVLTQDTAFIAEFERNNYTVSVTSLDISKGSVVGSTSTLYQEQVTISATPATGFQFNGWSDGNMDNPRTLTVTQDTVFVASFGTKMCTLTIISNNEDAADITGAGTYEYGTTVTCSIDVLSGYNFVKWSNGNTYNPYRFKIYDDITLYAFFEDDSGTQAVPTEMLVTPGDNDANLQWPQVDNATSYAMTITKGGETICTLTFDGLGRLVNIDFAMAPARVPAASTTASTTSGFNFTITGLESATTYGYRIEAKNEMGDVLSTEKGFFTTTGVSQAIEDVTASIQVEKFIRNGHLFIHHDGKTYNVQGNIVSL